MAKVITFSDMMGNRYTHFWSKFRERFPNDFKKVWYEVFVDFWENCFNENLPLENNLQNAYTYLKEHVHDYD